MNTSTTQNPVINYILVLLFVLVISSFFGQDIIELYAGNGTGAFAGDGGTALTAQTRLPSDICIDNAANKYIVDANNHCIRKVTPGGIISTVVGIGGSSGFSGDGGAATAAKLNQPGAMCMDAAGNMYIADATNHRIRKVTAATGIITTIAGTGTASSTGDGGLATAATINFPYGIALDNAGNIYICESSGHYIRKITVSTGVISTYAGTGVAGSTGDGAAATACKLNFPRDICIDALNNLYIADRISNKIRKITAASGIISTIAGTGTAGSTGDGGAATAARLRSPFGVAVDGLGNIYIADANNNKIRKITSSTGLISTFAGTGTGGYSGDGGDATLANLNFPTNVYADASYLYVADNSNNRIRRIAITPIALPLGFNVFTANVNPEKKVILEWNAYSEMQLYNYSIERSSNGLDWESFASYMENDNGHDLNEYTILDESPFTGLSYYKLSRIDNNGQVQLLGIQSVQIEGLLMAYPNPVQGEDLHLVFPAKKNSTVQLEWIDATGKTVKSELLEAENDLQEYKIQTSGFEAGKYSLIIRNGNASALQREIIIL